VVVKTAHSPSFPAFYVYDHTTWIQEGDVYVEAYDATAIYLVDGSYWNQTGTVTVALGQSADGSFTTLGSVHQHPLLSGRSLTSAQCRGVRFQIGLVAGELDHRHGNQQIREYVLSHNSTTLVLSCLATTHALAFHQRTKRAYTSAGESGIRQARPRLTSAKVLPVPSSF
jgi:hypothetical protein